MPNWFKKRKKSEDKDDAPQFARGGSMRNSLTNYNSFINSQKILQEENRRLRLENEFLSKRMLSQSRQNGTNHMTVGTQTYVADTDSEQWREERRMRRQFEATIASLLMENQKQNETVNGLDQSQNKHDETGLKVTADSYDNRDHSVTENIVDEIDGYLRGSHDLNLEGEMSDGDREMVKRVAECIGPDWHFLCVTLGMPMDRVGDLQDMRLSMQERVWRVMVDAYRRSGAVDFIKKLKDACEIIGIDIKGQRMDSNQKRRIEVNWPYLRENIYSVELVMPHLRKYLRFSSARVEYILTDETRGGKIDRMLTSLISIGGQAFPAFIQALRDSSHGFVVKKLEEQKESTIDTTFTEVMTRSSKSEMGDDLRKMIFDQSPDVSTRIVQEMLQLRAEQVERRKHDEEGMIVLADLKTSVKHVEAMMSSSKYDRVPVQV